MLRYLHDLGHNAPIFSNILKVLFSGMMAFVVFVAFVMDPIKVVSMNGKVDTAPFSKKYYIETVTYKSILAEYFCTEENTTLHRVLVTEDGYKINLDSVPEPYGYRVPGKENLTSVEHNFNGAKDGESLEVYKTYSYRCLGVNRYVRSPVVVVTFHENFSLPLPKIDGLRPETDAPAVGAMQFRQWERK